MPTQTVPDWLTALRRNDELRYHLVEALRQLALAAGPSVTEEIKYGGILFSAERNFGGVYSYANHVSLEFSEGANLPDPAGLLEGKGKGRRHLKFTAITEIAPKPVATYLAQAYTAAS